jgi:hydrogenase maturation factor
LAILNAENNPTVIRVAALASLALCVTRVAEVISVRGDKAKVKFVESDATRVVDVSLVEARKGSYVEVFADQALSTLTKAEADWRKQVWSDLRSRLEEATVG